MPKKTTRMKRIILRRMPKGFSIRKNVSGKGEAALTTVLMITSCGNVLCTAQGPRTRDALRALAARNAIPLDQDLYPSC